MYFSIFITFSSSPPPIASSNPTTTYITANSLPKNDISISIEATSTIGEEIKKAKVIPSGSPALVKPIKIGILEQEQKGVTVPRSAAIAAPFTPVKPVRIRLVRSGGK